MEENEEQGNTSQPLDMPHREEIVVVIPAYNEARFIGSVALMAAKFASTIIVVDDGSSDATAVVAAASGAVIYQHASNQGKGSALNSGFRLAREYDPKVVVTLDADGQHLPEEIGTLVAPILKGEADIVVGSRYLNHTSTVPRHRIWGHWRLTCSPGSAQGCLPPIHRADFGRSHPPPWKRLSNLARKDFRSNRRCSSSPRRTACAW